MATGDVKKAFVASVTLTVTNLHSLAASATYVGGWESARIDHSADLVLDDKIGLHLVTHASNRQAGAIRVYIIPALDDTPTWPDVFDGTESAESVTDTEELDSCGILAREIVVDNTASAVYDLTVDSVKAVCGGNMPRDYVIFVTGNATTTTTAQLAAAGSTVKITSSYRNVAP